MIEKQSSTDAAKARHLTKGHVWSHGVIFITEWALIESEIRKREKCVSSKKYSADGLLHDLEGSSMSLDWWKSVKTSLAI